MSDRSGHICPECGAPWESGGSPTCDCARRAADELLETRSAEAAAAEDFDPLRIRPYVDLGVRAEGSVGPGSTTGAGSAPDPGPASSQAPGEEGAAATTARVPDGGRLGHEAHGSHGGSPGDPAAVTSGPPGGPAGPDAHGRPDADALGTIAIPVQRPPSEHAHSPEHQGRQEGPETSDATTRLPRTTALPHPMDTQLFESGPLDRPSGPADFPDGPAGPTDPGGAPSRRRRFVLVGAGATAVVIAAAGFAGGLFSYESPSRNGAAPDDIRASVPDASMDAPSPSDSVSAPPSVPASESTGESASPSASEPPAASATSSRTTAATPAQPGDNAENAENSAPAAQPPSAPPEKAEPLILRRGDEGPEVLELQLRLKQLALYLGSADGTYDNRTENAVRNYQFTRGIDGEQGTYGTQTRQRLESETTEP